LTAKAKTRINPKIAVKLLIKILVAKVGDTVTDVNAPFLIIAKSVKCVVSQMPPVL